MGVPFATVTHSVTIQVARLNGATVIRWSGRSLPSERESTQKRNKFNQQKILSKAEGAKKGDERQQPPAVS